MVFEKIIVLDDELIIRKTLEESLRRKRYSVASASTVAEAEALLQKENYDLLISDINLPDGDGKDLLKRVASKPDSPMVIMMTGAGTVEAAVECMRAGAYDYILKPFSSGQMLAVVEKAEAFNQVVKVSRFFNQEQGRGGTLLGDSPQMGKLTGLIAKVAPTDATVLINGENGTGKELVATELFRGSSRSEAPFIKVNCAAVSETLIESEFFGHEKGAFTGANDRRVGRFELAHGGTILLDEISEITPKLQAKLLRVLQEREFERVGGNKTIQVDVRVFATTNRNLAQAVEKGEFREDLFYRLNVFPLHVPPLRERAGDVQFLAHRFLERLSRRYGRKAQGYSPAALDALVHYPWPGNVRELQNLIERAVILAEGGVIDLDLLGLPTGGGVRRLAAPAGLPLPGAVIEAGPEPVSLGALPSLEEVEKQHILRALECSGGNRTQAANVLKISIRTLRNKLHQYRIEAGEGPEPEVEEETPAG